MWRQSNNPAPINRRKTYAGLQPMVSSTEIKLITEALFDWRCKIFNVSSNIMKKYLYDQCIIDSNTSFKNELLAKINFKDLPELLKKYKYRDGKEKEKKED